MNSKTLAILSLVAIIAIGSISNMYAYGVNTSGNPRDPPTYNQDGPQSGGNISDNPRNPPDHRNVHFGFTNAKVCGVSICHPGQTEPSGIGAPELSKMNNYGGFLESKHINTE